MKTLLFRMDTAIATLLVIAFFSGCGKMKGPVVNSVPLKKHNFETVTVFFPPLTTGKQKRDENDTAGADRGL